MFSMFNLVFQFLLPTAQKRRGILLNHHYEALDCPYYVICKTHVVKISSSPNGEYIPLDVGVSCVLSIVMRELSRFRKWDNIA